MSSGFEDSCDGQPLAGLAKRFPAVKATLQTDSTQKKQAQRRQCVKLCDLALKFPEVACDVWAIAEPMLLKWQKHQGDKDDKFSDCTSSCGGCLPLGRVLGLRDALMAK